MSNEKLYTQQEFDIELLKQSTNKINNFLESRGDKHIDHEIRIQLLEKTSNKIIKCCYWILGTVIIGIALPVSLHSYHLI